jgi:hypothetical protein
VHATLNMTFTVPSPWCSSTAIASAHPVAHQNLLAHAHKCLWALISSQLHWVGTKRLVKIPGKHIPIPNVDTAGTYPVVCSIAVRPLFQTLPGALTTPWLGL